MSGVSSAWRCSLTSMVMAKVWRNPANRREALRRRIA
jgi:hypothetical protein